MIRGYQGGLELFFYIRALVSNPRRTVKFETSMVIWALINFPNLLSRRSSDEQFQWADIRLSLNLKQILFSRIIYEFLKSRKLFSPSPFSLWLDRCRLLRSFALGRRISRSFMTELLFQIQLKSFDCAVGRRTEGFLRLRIWILAEQTIAWSFAGSVC